MSQDRQMFHNKLRHSVFCKTIGRGELAKRFGALDNLRHANKQNFVGSIPGQKSFYLPGGW